MKRDKGRFPDDLIGNKLFELHQSGCDLLQPVDMVLIADFVTSRREPTVGQARTQTNAGQFQSNLNLHYPDVRLLDFSDPDFGIDISVEAHRQVIVTHSAMKEEIAFFRELVTPFSGSVRWYIHNPLALTANVVLAPSKAI